MSDRAGFPQKIACVNWWQPPPPPHTPAQLSLPSARRRLSADYIYPNILGSNALLSRQWLLVCGEFFHSEEVKVDVEWAECDPCWWEVVTSCTSTTKSNKGDSLERKTLLFGKEHYFEKHFPASHRWRSSLFGNIWIDQYHTYFRATMWDFQAPSNSFLA